MCVLLFQPDDLMKQFIRLNQDPHRFIHWMQKKCQAKAGHAKKASDVVRDLIYDEAHSSWDNTQKLNEMWRATGDGRKKYTILTTKSLLKPLKVQNVKTIDSSAPHNKADLPATKNVSNSSKMKVSDSTVKSAEAGGQGSSNDDKDDDTKDGLNQHISKLRGQFSDMHDSASQKMLELQSELGKMQHMSHEFDVLAEFLTSEEKLSIFEQNLDRLQKTVRLTEDKIHEINTNNQKMGRMIRQINETAKKQHDNNERAIVAIGERLERWELKLDRVTRKITNQKIDGNDIKANRVDDLGQLKDDIENVLNSRLADVSKDMENMKSVVICIITLIVLKMFVFDLFKDDIHDKVAQLPPVEELGFHFNVFEK